MSCLLSGFDVETAWRKITMLENIIIGLIALALLVYLGYALIHPERL